MKIPKRGKILYFRLKREMAEGENWITRPVLNLEAGLADFGGAHNTGRMLVAGLRGWGFAAPKSVTRNRPNRPLSRSS